MLDLIHLMRGASAPLVAYAWQDYALALWVVVPFLVWIVFEFLGALRAVGRIMARLTGQTPASAQEAAERVSGPYERRPRIALRQAAHHHHDQHHHGGH